jgi:hypothetical protein
MHWERCMRTDFKQTVTLGHCSFYSIVVVINSIAPEYRTHSTRKTYTLKIVLLNNNKPVIK